MSGSDGPDQEIATLMKNILKGKSLSCDDINTISDAREELSRIRKLTSNYQKGKLGLGGEKKGGRNALHEEENINDYVKEVFPKDDNVRQLIYTSIEDKVLLEGNTQDELIEIVDIFQPCSFEAGDVVIQQGQEGDELYVVEKGELSVTVRVDAEHGETSVDASFNEVKIGNYSDGSAFGELALIYGSPRAASAASIIATDACKLWRIKRAWYRGVVGQHRQKLRKEKIKFLKSVEINGKAFDDVFTKDQLSTIAELLKQESFIKGATIVREAELGDTVYIVQSGIVDIYKNGINYGNPFNSLGRKQFFGEKALLKDDVRGATVKAASDAVFCYVMTRSDFSRVLGNMGDFLDGKVATRKSRISSFKQIRVNYDLNQLKLLNVLGQGAFGKVRLAKALDSGEFYALREQGKHTIVENKRQKYFLNELSLMKELQHPNMIMLHCDMQDNKNVYSLLGLLPGGELMDILQSKGRFPEEWTRFYSASVLLAYSTMHEKRIVYRALKVGNSGRFILLTLSSQLELIGRTKPENLVLDEKGYCVVVNLGLAKKLIDGPTYTLCGTPDYMAPEIIRGTGYSLSVDYWALGVLLYELTAGSAPFQAYDPSLTYKKILEGRVNFPSGFSNQIQLLIKALLNKDFTRRLGCMEEGTEGVMKHRWYSGYDWTGLLNREVDENIPYKPKVPEYRIPRKT